MKCLYCGKTINENASEHEKTHSWHAACIKKFFGTDDMPVIDISKDKLEELANETINKGLTVPGVQKKLSLHLSTDAGARLTIVDYPSGYILKPQTEEYEMLPEFENLAMRMADMSGIDTVDNALIKNNGAYAYITKRADRYTDETGMTQMYAMEDFCQLSERLTMDKYKGSYEKCTKIIREYSLSVDTDITEMFRRIVFSFITGNSDMHLKNFSLIESCPGNRQYNLSPAYDMLPVNIVLPEDNEQMALTMNGKKSRFKRKDFMIFAEKCGIAESEAEKIIEDLCSLKQDFMQVCDESYLSDDLKEQTKKLISERTAILEH